MVFREDELRSLKAQLHQSEQQWRKLERKPDQPKDTVAFRLDNYYLRVLRSEADRLGLSTGEFARTLVIRALEQEQDHILRREVRRMREALGATFYALLTMKLGTSPAEARRIVNDTILKD